MSIEDLVGVGVFVSLCVLVAGLFLAGRVAHAPHCGCGDCERERQK